MLATGVFRRRSTPMSTMYAISSLRTFSGKRNAGIFERISPPGTGSASNIVHS